MSTAVLEEPETMPEAASFVPFAYQAEAFDAILREFDSGKRSTMVAMATGTGKTCLAGMLAREFTEVRCGRALFLAHRDELLEGAQSDIARVGVDSAIEKAEQYARRAIADAANDLYHPRDIRCVVGSVQSMVGDRLASWPRDYFGLIITDECHHSCRRVGPKKRRRTVPNEQYGAIYRHFPLARRVGLTATPRRKDQAELGLWYESVAYQYLLPRAIDDGNLARLTIAPANVTIDLTQVNMGAEDLNQGDLEDAISPYIEKMCRGIKNDSGLGDRRAILFAPPRKSKDQKLRPCEAFADGLRKLGITAQAVWGDHPDRLAIGRAFREGEFQVICNADLYSEGVNFPFVSAVILASPTASPVVLAQRIGRGTRIYPGKDDCLVVTYDWQYHKHQADIVTPFTIVRPEGADDAARIAAEILASGEETDILKAAAMAEERAAEERARREEEERKRAEAEAKRLAEREQAKAKAEEIRRSREDAAESKRARLEREAINLRVRDGESGLRFSRFDPFASTLQLAGLDRSPARGTAVGPRSNPRQVAALALYGVDPAEAAAMSETEASAMRTWCYRRYSGNLATVPQWKALMRLGVERGQALAFTRKEASAYLDRFGARRRHG